MNRVVVGYDGSAPSQGALMWATAIADRTGAPLDLVDVVDDDWGMAGQDWAHETEHRAAVLLSSTASTHQAPGGVTTRLLHGSTVQELATAVEPDDLLVVGSHKSGYTRGRALGSLSVRLATVAPCSMLVVPAAPTVPGRRGIVVGVGPELSEAALRVATREAAAREQPLTLIAAATRSGKQSAAAALDRAQEWITQRDAPVVVTRRVVDRPPAEALLEASRSALLLVLGHSTAPGGGGTTHDVLMNPVSAIWIAR